MASGPSAIIKLVSTNPKDIDAIASQIKTIATSINVKSRGPVPFLRTPFSSQRERRHAAMAATHMSDGRCASTSGS